MITCRDNEGNLIQLPKEKFKKRPSVYGFIRNGTKLVVTRNSYRPECIWFPGGGVESGENLEEALRREIEEETGLIKVKIERKLDEFMNFFYYRPTDEAMDAIIHVYECFTEETVLKTPERIEDKDVSSNEWMELKEVLKTPILDLEADFKKILASLH